MLGMTTMPTNWKTRYNLSNTIYCSCKFHAMGVTNVHNTVVSHCLCDGYIISQAGLQSEEEDGPQQHLQVSASAEDSSNNHAHGRIVSNSMLLGLIDPLLWKQETERVASKLVAGTA